MLPVSTVHIKNTSTCTFKNSNKPIYQTGKSKPIKGSVKPCPLIGLLTFDVMNIVPYFYFDSVRSLAALKKKFCGLPLSCTNLSEDIQGVLSLVVRKPVFVVSDQVRHKPGCTVTEDG